MFSKEFPGQIPGDFRPRKKQQHISTSREEGGGGEFSPHPPLEPPSQGGVSITPSPQSDPSKGPATLPMAGLFARPASLLELAPLKVSPRAVLLVVVPTPFDTNTSEDSLHPPVCVAQFVPLEVAQRSAFVSTKPRISPSPLLVPSTTTGVWDQRSGRSGTASPPHWMRPGRRQGRPRRPLRRLTALAFRSQFSNFYNFLLFLILTFFLTRSL